MQLIDNANVYAQCPCPSSMWVFILSVLSISVDISMTLSNADRTASPITAVAHTGLRCVDAWLALLAYGGDKDTWTKIGDPATCTLSWPWAVVVPLLNAAVPINGS